MDDILEKFGISYEDLTASEKETYNTWITALRKGQLSVERIRDFIADLRNSVSTDLANEPEYHTIFIFKVRNDNNILLKARLRNLMLIEAFLSTPQKARKQLEAAISSFAGQLRDEKENE